MRWWSHEPFRTLVGESSLYRIAWAAQASKQHPLYITSSSLGGAGRALNPGEVIYAGGGYSYGTANQPYTLKWTPNAYVSAPATLYPAFTRQHTLCPASELCALSEHRFAEIVFNPSCTCETLHGSQVDIAESLDSTARVQGFAVPWLKSADGSAPSHSYEYPST